MYSHPLSDSIPNSEADSAKAAEFRLSANRLAILNHVQQFPEVRANVVAAVAATWHSNELTASVDSDAIARAILQCSGE